MHKTVRQWVAAQALGTTGDVLDIGGRSVNGHQLRAYFPGRSYAVLDVVDAPDVDIVADATSWPPPRHWGTVLCTEVFEHVEYWPAIIHTAYMALLPQGRFIATCAGPGRAPHSGRAAVHDPEPDEWYRNPEPAELEAALSDAGFVDVMVRQYGLDLQAAARKP